ncbi:MAG: symmetrical bis(5'-nucleosyl)-tetraphosphatase [Amphritea sp.]
MATYAIGDIQGCYTEFKALLEKVNFSSDDQLWVAGDMVNRGPESLATLRHLMAMGDQAKVVLGNHDLHLLAIHFNTTHPRRSDTIHDILEAPDRHELMEWLRHQPLIVTDQRLGFAMVHAGIPPKWSIKKARRRAREVEQVLQSTLAREYFRHMYGNTPDHWSKSLEGWERLRMITNYFTRMRFCNSKGRLDFSVKGGLHNQPEGFKPWFEHHGQAVTNGRIIFGHWAALEGKAEHDNVYALDTGCVWGNELTALRLEDQQLFSVASQQRYSE